MRPTRARGRHRFGRVTSCGQPTVMRPHPPSTNGMSLQSLRALIDAMHVGRACVLTGPQSISQRDKVRAIGESIGRNLSWQEIPPEQVRQAMLARGLPEDAPDRLLGYLADHVQTPGPSSETVEQILQRPGLTFAEWATEHA